MQNRKLGRPTDQRLAMLRGQVTALFWYGKIETTYDRAKEVASMAERLLTKAINSYKDIAIKEETRKNTKGQDIKVQIHNDGATKLAARRAIMAKLYEIPELRQEGEKNSAYRARTKSVKHPVIEKIFNDYAPRYDKRAQETGTKGGYTRVLKLGERRGDAAEMAIIEFVL